mgnify:FL=1
MMEEAKEAVTGISAFCEAVATPATLVEPSRLVDVQSEPLTHDSSAKFSGPDDAKSNLFGRGVVHVRRTIGAGAADVGAELPALVCPLGPRAAFVVSVAQLIVPASTSSGAIAPVEIDPKSV